ncbi:MAG TPA: formylmethanofuran dehydrogenase subunit B [Pirellulales bacterium]|nr:formylmethanofuran dehydrogenase subunit B [Pirellulales bacterium]
MSSAPLPAGPRRVADATCTYCTCMCDDIVLSVENNRITDAKNACGLGREWFLRPRPEDLPACTIEGREATVEEGIERAAQLLTLARYPLVYGLTETTSEAQRVAVAIADWLGGTLDTGTSVGHAPSVLAIQSIGKVTCTLGEIRNRSDLIVFWGSNCVETHPRVFTKYTAMPEGMFVPRGRADRTCVAIDVKPTKTTGAMDLFLQIKPNADYEAIWILRALAKGLSLDESAVREQTGVPLAAWSDLMDRMKRARFGAIIFGMGLMRSRGEHANCEALFQLNRELNGFTRFVTRSIRARGNVTGGDKLVGWRTGYPYAIDLTRGYPRYSPGEYTSLDVLARREADAALIVAADPLRSFGEAACEGLRSTPYVCVGSQATATARAALVNFNTATYGIHTAGTVYRMDDVPIRLRPALASRYPSEVDVLSRLENRIRQLQSVSAGE